MGTLLGSAVAVRRPDPGDVDLVHLLLERLGDVGRYPVEEAVAGQPLDLLDGGPEVRPAEADLLVVGHDHGDHPRALGDLGQVTLTLAPGEHQDDLPAL